MCKLLLFDEISRLYVDIRALIVLADLERLTRILIAREKID